MLGYWKDNKLELWKERSSESVKGNAWVSLMGPEKVIRLVLMLDDGMDDELEMTLAKKMEMMLGTQLDKRSGMRMA